MINRGKGVGGGEGWSLFSKVKSAVFFRIFVPDLQCLPVQSIRQDPITGLHGLSIISDCIMKSVFCSHTDFHLCKIFSVDK